jgi:hypothetical protein
MSHGTESTRGSAGRWAGALCLPFLLLLLFAPMSRADILELTPTQDNTLFENATGALSNGAGPYFFAGRNTQGNTRRGVLQFDIAGNLPPGSVITTVALKLHVSKTSPSASPTPVSLHRVLASWGEGTSFVTNGMGVPSTPGDATWIHRFFPDSLWTTPGGDFEATPSAVTTVDGIGSYIWTDPAMIADVESWLAAPQSNFGWLVQGDESASANGEARRYDSRENENENVRPLLTIEYTASQPVYSVTWGRVKARWGRSTP